MTTTGSEAAEKVRGIGKLFAEKIRRIEIVIHYVLGEKQKRLRAKS